MNYDQMRNAAAQACRHTREIIGAATGSSIAMALAEAEDRIRKLPDPIETAAASTLGHTERSIAERTQAEMNDVAEAEREACIRIIEDLRPRNDQSDWTEYAHDIDAILRRGIAAIAARYDAPAPPLSPQ